MSDVLPPPNCLGAPDKFDSWRDGQAEIAVQIMNAVDGDVLVLQCPTGFGKSLTYVVGSLLRKEDEQRACILVGTKALQDQLVEDFPGLYIVKGRSAFKCEINKESAVSGACRKHGTGSGCQKTCPKGGPYEECKRHQGICFKDEKICARLCEYKKQFPISRTKWIVLTNYSLFLAHRNYGSLGEFNTLVCDETHDIERWVDSAASMKFEQAAIVNCLLPGMQEELDSGEVGLKCVRGLLEVVIDIRSLCPETKNLYWDQVKSSVEVLIASAGSREEARFAVRVNRGQTWEVCAINTQYLTQKMLMGAAKVKVLASATVTPKTLMRLGWKKTKVEEIAAAGDFIVAPSPIPLKQRPVYYIPTVRVRFGMTAGEEREWLHRMDEIIDAYPELKGIIHAHSYTRAQRIMEWFAGSERVISHTSRDTIKTVQRFKESRDPLVLVSPAISTGFDFPGDQCRFQIIAKIPYPHTQDAVVKARVAHDKKYSGYLASMTLQQAVGRGNRGPTDWSDTWIIDDSWKWFRKQNTENLTREFLDSVTAVRTVLEVVKERI